MDAKQYVKMCQEVSVCKTGLKGIKENIPDRLIVVYNDIRYYPYRYSLGFTKGETIHYAILRECKSGSLLEIPLSILYRDGHVGGIE